MAQDLETKTWIDKSAWGRGPWQDEPDRAEWRDEATGLSCLAIRHIHGGHWCGYVGIPPEHPWHDDPPEDLAGAHGAITYTSPCFEGNGPDDPQRVCHVPRPGESDHVLWMGFDCAHACDYAPAWSLELSAWNQGIYRPLNYVRECCAAMAAEVAASRG